MRSRREGDTGLGLSIAQAVALQHGGRITVTSKLGVGSCFLSTYPRFLQR
ncbi:MAG: ATP-binding protein [Planktothrix sp.]